MLQVFLANAGRTLSKQELMQAVWPNVHVTEDSLFQCIREIRTALGDNDRQLVRLVAGGYVFGAEVARGFVESPIPGGTSEGDGAALSNQSGGATALVIPEATSEIGKRMRVRSGAIIAALAGLCTLLLFTVAAMAVWPDILSMQRPSVALTIVDTSNVPQAALMASNVSSDVIEGLSKISTIRVLSPPPASASVTTASESPVPDILVEGRLQKDGQNWTLQAQVIRSGEVRWSTSASVATENADEMLQRSRLAGALGYNLAQYINTLLYPGERQTASDAQKRAKIVVEQATSFISQTSRERFAAAQALLENALANDPDNIDLEAALAGHLLRGIQSSWYSPADSDAAERRAQQLLERALHTEPKYLPVLESYCRFLTATNHFVESLVACANALTFDPWDGLVRFNLGMAQAQLGRFSDALQTFEEADRFDTPAVSRWTWLLGAGLSYLLMGRDEEALPWLQRSLAVTPGTGRTQMLMAAAYELLGRFDEAKATMAKGLALRPGSTADNVNLPFKNASPLWIQATKRINLAEIAAGLPEH
jgi:tetratricopeptide (TPR) repeat protein